MKELGIIFVILAFVVLEIYLRTGTRDTVVIIEHDNLSLNTDNVINYMSVIGIKEEHQLEVLSQIIYETGHFCSSVRFNNNNLFGIRVKGKYAEYSHWTESISHWKRLFYNEMEATSYFKFLAKFGKYSEQDTKIYLRNLRMIKNNLNK